MTDGFAGKKIFIAPLDWGLGHATRCIPVIDQFIENGATVIIGGNGRSLILLRDAYPELSFVELPGYNFQYPDSGSMVWKVGAQIPTLLTAIKKEVRFFHTWITENKIDYIISDNRYGIYHPNIPSIFICHQVALMVPEYASWTRPLLFKAHVYMINPFNEVWIPDFEGQENLSGGLSHDYYLKKKCEFIGPLSRFAGMLPSSNPIDKPFHLIMLSGPEPQRTILEQKLIQQAQTINENFVLLRGVTENREEKTEKNVLIRNYASGQEIFDLVYYAESVICRSGYSSIMDLAVLGKKTIFIPTPGQTEQEYLAQTLKNKKVALSYRQSTFELRTALNELNQISGFNKMAIDGKMLESAIGSLLS